MQDKKVKDMLGGNVACEQPAWATASSGSPLAGITSRAMWGDHTKQLEGLRLSTMQALHLVQYSVLACWVMVSTRYSRGD